MTCIGERFCRSPVHKATNGGFGDMGCKAAISMTHVQGIAALAIAAGAQVRFVRTCIANQIAGSSPLPAQSGHSDLAL